MSMVSLATGTRTVFTSARPMMRLSSQLLLLEFVRILKLESKNSLAATKNQRMPTSTSQTTPSIKMILPRSTLQVASFETSWLLVSAVNCLQFTFGILWQWCQLLNSLLAHQLRELQLFPSVHAKDMSHALTKVMTTTCTFTMYRGKRCFYHSLQVPTPFITSSGRRNLMIWNLLLWQLDLFNSGTQLMLLKNYSRMVHLDKSTPKQNSTVPPSTKTVSAIQVVPMVVFTCGIKSRILDLCSKLMLAK